MLVSLKRSKTILLVSALFNVVMLSFIFRTQQVRFQVDENYHALLKRQSARFAKIQAEQKRRAFLDQYHHILEPLIQEKDPDQLRREVLDRLEKLNVGTELGNVRYQFLESQERAEINASTSIVRDSLRLNGIVDNMLAFNRSMLQLGEGPPYFFELSRCDIKRRSDPEEGLDFECVLSWYSLA